MSKRKTWREKLADSKDFPRVEKISPGMAKKWGPGTIVIPAPKEVDAIMRKVPKGKLITINQIREIVARRHGATIGCPMVTGILARVSAGAADEEEHEGKKRITPYWRTLKGNGEINPKYPGGTTRQKKRLRAEGHSISTRGAKVVVKDFEKLLVNSDKIL